MGALVVIPYQGCVIKAYQDEITLDPRTKFERLTRMICFHRRYNLGDKHSYRRDEFGSVDELEDRLRKDFDPVVIKPLYLMDHSGLTLNTTGFSGVDPQGWDWGFVGFVLLPHKTAEAESMANSEVAEAALDAEVREYSQYIEGAVYCYTLERNGVTLDSCGGVYLADNETLESNHVVDEFKSYVDGLKKTGAIP